MPGACEGAAHCRTKGLVYRWVVEGCLLADRCSKIAQLFFQVVFTGGIWGGGGEEGGGFGWMMYQLHRFGAELFECWRFPRVIFPSSFFPGGRGGGKRRVPFAENNFAFSRFFLVQEPVEALGGRHAAGHQHPGIFAALGEGSHCQQVPTGGTGKGQGGFP